MLNNQQALSKWQAAASGNYSFILQQECYCSAEYLKPFYIVVRDYGKAEVRYLESNELVPDYVFQTTPTIEDIFRGINQAETNGYGIQSEYNAYYGYPNYIFFSHSPQSSEDDIAYSISFFRAE
ncbi:MAG: DUF6174 domain-containing protein [Deinococcales bacterium]